MKNELMTEANTISSQGVMVSSDKKACLIHDSTYPPLLHQLEYGPDYSQGINMDRGGYGFRDDGSFYACLFDGTGGGGLASFYAAQDFTEEMLSRLREGHLAFTDDLEHDRVLVTKLLTTCSFSKWRLTSSGNATCVLVDCLPNQKQLLLNGGALGDSGIIHVNGRTHEATLFETILKDDRSNMSDTGGCLGRDGMIYRPDNIAVISHGIEEGDFVVLASDGLLDNLNRGQESQILSLIVASELLPPFDHPLVHLPTAEELQKILKPSTPSGAQDVAKRLNNYIKQVTASKYELLESYLTEWHKVAMKASFDKEERLFELGQKFKEGDQTFAGKCDDCLIIVISN